MGLSRTGRLEDITRRLVAEFTPETIILFGSHAWGQPDENSDLDLLEESVDRASGCGRRSREGAGVRPKVEFPPDLR